VADLTAVLRLAQELAPDVHDELRQRAKIVDGAMPPTGVVARARARRADPQEVAHSKARAPLVLLDHPRHLGNIGAAIRVAAAAGAAGVLCVGPHDPWDPTAIRGAAGLQYALPIARADELPPSDRPTVVFDPDGDPFEPALLPERATVAFGSERRGLSKETRGAADLCLSLPMQPGVSSLNLATAVAAVLYAWRLSRR
jgi:RNA methyltransferase, TrmH family